MQNGRAVALAALIAGLTACALAPEPADVLLENVTLVDPQHGLRRGQRVAVRGEHIVAVGAMGGPAPASRSRHDARGRFLIPGLWDMHVHFLYDEALTGRMSELFLRHGITSVRDTGGDLARLAALRARLAEDPAPEPRIFLSGPLLDGALPVYDGGDPGRPKLGVAVPDAHAAQRRVEALAAGGADFVKVYELVEPEVFDALVAAARARGLPIAAHVPLAMTAAEAGPRVDSMEHLRNLELACARDWAPRLEARRAAMRAFAGDRGYDLRRSLHAEQRLPAIAAYDEAQCDRVLDALTETIQVPTLRLNALAITRRFEREDWVRALDGLPDEVRRRWRAVVGQIPAGEAAQELTRFAEWSLFLVGRLRARGVPIGAGTDTPIGLAIPGDSLHTELALLVRAGLSPRAALAAATLVPAAFFGLEGELGRIEPGFLADLVLLDADPLVDIENTRRVRRVMSRGVWAFAADGDP